MSPIKLVFLLLLFFSITLSAQQSGIRFLQSPAWEEVLEQAQRQRKYIFLDASTTWCAPCKLMEREVFTRPSEGHFFNENFVNVKYDMEKGEGIRLKKQFDVNVFPTYLFLDWNGTVVHKIVGAYVKEGEFLVHSRLALTPGDSYGALMARYRNGERSPGMMFSYLRALRLAGQTEQAEAAGKSYLSRINEDHFMDSTYWRIIKHLMRDANSREFNILIEHRQQIAAAIGQQEVEGKIFSVIDEQIRLYGTYKLTDWANIDHKKEEELIRFLREWDFPRSNELLARALIVLYHRNKEWERYAAVADAMLDFKLLKDNEFPLRELDGHAAVFTEKVEDRELLKRALRWSEHACEREKRPEELAVFYKTKALLWRKLGNEGQVREAFIAADRAATEATAQGRKRVEFPLGEGALNVVSKPEGN